MRRGVFIAKGEGALVETLLDRIEQRRRLPTKSAVGRNCFPFTPSSRRLTATLPFSRSRGPSSTRSGTPFLIHSQFFVPPPMSRLIDVHFQRCAVPGLRAQFRRQFLRGREHRFARFRLRHHRHDDDVRRRDARRQNEPIVVAHAP